MPTLARDRSPRRSRTRAPEATRERLVAAAFEEIHRHGYQGAGLDTILANAGVTKGALYHHFADKADLAHAVIDEVIRGLTLTRWTGPLASYTGDPISGIQMVLKVVADEFCDERLVDKVELGCPLNNLAQEMSPLDERFRRRVAVVFETWIESFAQALERGREGRHRPPRCRRPQSRDLRRRLGRGLLRPRQERQERAAPAREPRGAHGLPRVLARRAR